MAVKHWHGTYECDSTCSYFNSTVKQKANDLPTGNIYLRISKKVSLSCNSTESPVWIYNVSDRPGNIEVKYSNKVSQLTIANTDYKHSSNYSCYAINNERRLQIYNWSIMVLRKISFFF